MRVCFISYDEYINIPYIKNYEELLKKKKIEYDVILWDRRNVIKEREKNHFWFRCHVSRSKLSKFVPFLKWRRFVLSVLKKERYDALIILTSIPGVLMYSYLKRHRIHYLFDIRDYTLEYIPVYRKIINQLVQKSMLTCFSSEGFREWLLPSKKLCLVHNITNIKDEFKGQKIVLQLKQLVIGFVGGIRYEKENCKIVEAFKEYPNIILKYIGKLHSGIQLPEYCKKHRIVNVEFEPEYRNEEKPEIYKKIDIINAVYGDVTPVVKTALPNKLYDCILFKKPIMVSKHTYLASVVEQYHLGFAVDINRDNLYDELKEYVEHFDEQVFLEGCQKWLEKVLKEDMAAKNRLNQWIAELASKEME